MKNHMFIRTAASTVIAAALLTGGDVSAKTPSFTDIPSTHWAQKSGTIAWGVEEHVISGYKDGTFKPDHPVTEAEFLSMLIGLYIADLGTEGTHWADPHYKHAQALSYPLAGLQHTQARQTKLTRTKVAELLAAANGVHYTNNNAIRYVLGKKMAQGKIPGVISIESYRGQDLLTRAEALQMLRTAKERGLTELKPRPVAPSDPALLPPLPGEQEQHLPKTKDSSIMIEGMPQKITLALFQKQNVPFYTYYPTDMIAETMSSDEGGAARFIANFGGFRNDKAFMHVYFPAAHMQTEQKVLSLIQSYGYKETQQQSTTDVSWAEKAYMYTKDGQNHRLLLGKHAGQYFIVQIQYPVEYGDGISPRIAKIFEEWRWSDTKKPLVPSK
ncbi:S-layer homology domain-containing protein [Aneurinibacillus sp. REN35]|uniref:S-layer homology domain-containing protein n=1 Tax=Aneurinibacillus sp. REN35 TaxID=3237286 RepID=UPI0035289902